VAVEVVRLQVQEHADARSQLVHVLELERRELDDEPRVRRRSERGERAADVPCDLDGLGGSAEHRTDELHRRRLAVRAGDADERVREQARAELDLAPDRDAARARGRRQGGVAGDAGALDEHVDAVEHRGVGIVSEAAIGDDDLHPALLERRLRRLARAGEPHDERLLHQIGNCR
jgi:hypothetical protein